MLPDDIVVLAQAEVDDNFQARFDAKQRVYKYFFVQNTLDTGLMQEAAQQFVGTHNFQNFCKINVLQTTNYVRTISSVKIERVCASDIDERLDLYSVTITGNGFLWHQVRYMMNVLFMIGKQQENKEIISDLLDLSRYKAKPNYLLADDYPLTLYDCVYDNLKFEYDLDTSVRIYEHYKSIIEKQSIQL